jgi:hypothetical protein
MVPFSSFSKNSWVSNRIIFSKEAMGILRVSNEVLFIKGANSFIKYWISITFYLQFQEY